MRAIPLMLGLLILGGCSTPETKTASSSETTPPPAAEAPTTPTSTGSAPSSSADTVLADPASKKVSAKIKVSELKGFLSRLGELSGHGGWTAEQLEAAIKEVSGIKKGENQAGAVHVDHNGGHQNIQMKIERLDDQTYSVEFETPDASMEPKLKEVLGTK